MDTGLTTATGREPGTDRATADSRVVEVPFSDWDQKAPAALQHDAIDALEDGKVLFFPKLAFPLSAVELKFLDPSLAGSSKNVSFNSVTGKLGQCACPEGSKDALIAMMARFAKSARQALNNLLPAYQKSIRPGRTSFRPVEIAGR